MNKNVHTFIGCDCEYEDAGIVIFGAPYDSTTSFRPGTRFASSAMRNESFGIETYSPYQDRDILISAYLTAAIWSFHSVIPTGLWRISRKERVLFFQTERSPA